MLDTEIQRRCPWQVAGEAEGSSTVPWPGHTSEVPGEQPEEVEGDRLLEAARGRLWGYRKGSVAAHGLLH